MRKKRFFVVLLLLCTVAAAFLTGCSNINQAVLDNVSEVHENVLEGGSDNLYMKIITGKKEKDFAMDGVSGKKTVFALISVTPAENYFAADAAPAYSFTYDNKVYAGTLKPSKTAERFSAEIELSLTRADELSVTVTGGDSSETLALRTLLNEDTLTSSEALDAAKMEFKPELEALYKNGKLYCEIYVRLVNNAENPTSEYFWYVAFLQPDETFRAVLINPKDGTVAAKRG